MTPLEIGFAVAGIVIALGSAVFAANRWLVHCIAKGDEKQAAALKAAEDKLEAGLKEISDTLHSRVNDIHDRYVRRDDLGGHLLQLEKGQTSMKNAIEQQTLRIDALYGVVTKDQN